MDELKEIITRLERIENLLRKNCGDIYSVDELFQYVLDKLLKDFAFFPEELELLEIPLESFERLLMEKVVYREDAKRYVQRMVKRGFIEYQLLPDRDHMGNSVEVPVVRISKEKIPKVVREDTVWNRVSRFYYAYQRKYQKPIQPGTVLTTEEWDYIEALSRKTVLFSILKPLVDKRIIVTEQDWVEFHQDLASAMPLLNIMVEIGIIQDIVEGDEIKGVRFLVDENEAYQLIRKFFGNKGRE